MPFTSTVTPDTYYEPIPDTASPLDLRSRSARRAGRSLAAEAGHVGGEAARAAGAVEHSLRARHLLAVPVHEPREKIKVMNVSIIEMKL